MALLSIITGANRRDSVHLARLQADALVFLPKHPVTKPKIADVLAEESKLDVSALVEEAMSTLEVVKL